MIHPAQRDRIDGWDAFEKRYRQVLASDADVQVETKRVDIDVAPSGNAGWALIEADLIVDGTVMPHWYVLVAQEFDDGWRIVLALASPVPQATPEPVP